MVWPLKGLVGHFMETDQVRAAVQTAVIPNGARQKPAEGVFSAERAGDHAARRNGLFGQIRAFTGMLGVAGQG